MLYVPDPSGLCYTLGIITVIEHRSMVLLTWDSTSFIPQPLYSSQMQRVRTDGLGYSLHSREFIVGRDVTFVYGRGEQMLRIEIRGLFALHTFAM